MTVFQKSMLEYRRQLEKGDIKRAYRGLMDYIMGLRLSFQEKYPDYSVSGNIYFGYMDMTYFSICSTFFKLRKLKIAVVFVHDAFRFEVWLSGLNKQVQTNYWKLFKENNWSKYHVPPTTKGVDSIIEHILVDNPEFGDLDNLTKQIQTETMKFINDVEKFLSVN